MSKYNINIDPKLPSEEETKSFQNFDSVIGDAQNIHRPSYVIQNIHKNFRLVKVVILIMIVLLAVFFSHKYKQKEEKQKEDNKEVSNLHLKESIKHFPYSSSNNF